MCERCLGRRSFVLGAASLALPGEAPAEVTLRLPPSQGLTVALTLDACPGGFDLRLAGALAESGIRATIFVAGDWIRRNPDGLAWLLARPDLFALQNHGEHHVAPVLGARRIYGIRPAGDLDAVRREVADGAGTLRGAGGPSAQWYRGATGLYSPAARTAIEAMPFRIAGYSLNADQGASLGAAAVARRIASARDGDVIIAHVNQPHRPAGQGVIEGARDLQRRGAVFVHLDGAT